MKYSQKTIYIIIACILVFAGCSPNSSNLDHGDDATTNQYQELVEAVPSPTDEPIVNLTICLASVPNNIEEAIKNKTLNSILFGNLPQLFSEESVNILLKYPSTSDNTLFQKAVSVSVGDMIVNNSNQVVPLMKGTWIRPAGCDNSNCAIHYDGNTVEMAQMVAIFDLGNNLSWQDGEIVTTSDSIFAYQWEKENLSSQRIKQTADYLINEEGKLEWQAIPGFFTQDFLQYFWSPLPQHKWSNQDLAELKLSDYLSTENYSISEVDEGKIVLKRKSNSSDPSSINQISLVEFKGDISTSTILNDVCDVVENQVTNQISAVDLLSAEFAGNFQLVSGNGNTWVSLYFGIVPLSYDDIYSMWGGDRADYFGETETRNAISQCLGTEYASQLFNQHGVEFSGFFPESHPMSIDKSTIVDDEFNANNYFDRNGWIKNEEGIRSSFGIPNIFDGTLFELNLFFPDDELMGMTAQIIANRLEGCGISVKLSSGPTNELFKTGNEGLVFGRNFDLAIIPWNTSFSSVCQLWQSTAVPGDDLDLYPYGWGGWNATGWQSEEFDSACQQSLSSFIGTPQFDESNQLAQEIFLSENPAISLFAIPSFWVASNQVCGLQVDPLTANLINVNEIDINQNCP